MHTLSVHVTIQVNSGDVVWLDRFNENALPYPTAGSIEDVTRVQSLFANGNDIVAMVSRVMHKDKSNRSV
jgi:thiamine monophosphate synthase